MRTILTILLSVVLSSLSYFGITVNTGGKEGANVPTFSQDSGATEDDTAVATAHDHVFIRSLEDDKSAKIKIFEDGVTVSVNGSLTTGKSPFKYNGKALSYAFANCSEITVGGLASPCTISVYIMLYNGSETTISYKKSSYKLINGDNYKICTFDVSTAEVTLTITGSSKIYGITIDKQLPAQLKNSRLKRSISLR